MQLNCCFDLKYIILRYNSFLYTNICVSLDSNWILSNTGQVGIRKLSILYSGYLILKLRILLIFTGWDPIWIKRKIDVFEE